MIYYTADLHFCHKNVLDLCNRPYEDVEEMNECLIESWNKKVTSEDYVYILGDVGFPRNQSEVLKITEIMKRLKGNKVLIRGNHDYKLLKSEDFKKCFIEIAEYKEIVDNGRKVVLFHYPIEEWNGYYRDAIHLFGHIHNNNENIKEKHNRYNVGVDVCRYAPISLDELMKN